jgi:hypothetical protein
MYIKQMGLFILVMKHSGLTLFGMPLYAQLKAGAKFG